MMILEMVPYNPEIHAPRSGWDVLAVEMALEEGKKLLVDQNGEYLDQQADGIMSARSERSESMKKQYLTAREVAEVCGVSDGKAYGLIREMVIELKAAGYLTVSGKGPVAFFRKKYYGFEEGGDSE